MSKDLTIKITNGILVIKENILINSLPSPVLEQALKRGRGYRRAIESQNRQLKTNAKGFDRWHLYEILKGNMDFSHEYIKYIQGMDKMELQEGIIEFLLTQ